MGPAILLLVILLFVLAVIGGLMARRFAAKSDADRRQVLDSDHVMRHAVPNGQDPAAVIVALRRAGFESTTDADDVHSLVIQLPLGPSQRDEVETVLRNEVESTLQDQDGSTSLPAERTQRFDDE